jgi:rfaE bifunctional protein kinase chain/domain
MLLNRYKCDAAALVDAVSRFRRKRILIVGDLMLDRFIWGSVSRISPEAPVPVVEIARESTCVGGAANVAANISSLGAVAIPLGIVGDDLEGRRLIEELRRLGAKPGGIVVDPDRDTSVKTRIIAHHQQVCRTDRENRSPISPRTQDAVARRFRRLVRTADAVVVSDYAKGLLSPGLLREILPPARKAGKIVCVDPKLSDLSAYRPATVITPNTLEAERASGLTITDGRSLVRAGRRILTQTRIPNLLITRGEHGMALFEGTAAVKHIPTVAREVFDVTGAGDTVISTLALGLASGLTMLESAILANVAAGIVVAKLGTASVTPQELLKKVSDLDI